MSKIKLVVELPQDWENRIASMSDSEIVGFLYGALRNGETFKIDDIKTELQDMQAEKTGEWITFNEGHIRNGSVVTTSKIYCSKCNGQVDYKSNFCPNCGSHNMIGGDSE